ncbi:MAG: DUF4294 domain-containing protein [Bacteroidetes bacterium]|nr:DUF4294 domain-containing protein [Bacteroidota bacterium]
MTKKSSDFTVLCFEKFLAGCGTLLNSKMKYLLALLFILNSADSFGQTRTGTKLPYVIEGIDTIPVVNLPDVNIVDYGADYEKRLKEFYRLRFNVIKVYPYARLAGIKIKQLNDSLALIKSDRDKRKYKKKFEDQLRDDFGKTIERLSVNQGKIFIKLLDRQTGSTGYEIIKDVKGSWSAFILQTGARVFGHNLKDDYDPNGDDKQIESIVQQIEAGLIN